jgi:hypothetical protein
MSNTMDLNVKAANGVLSNGSKDMKNVLAALPNTTHSAVSDARTSLMNGRNGTSLSSTRLQIIDESKNFTCVPSFSGHPESQF